MVPHGIDRPWNDSKDGDRIGDMFSHFKWYNLKLSRWINGAHRSYPSPQGIDAEVSQHKVG